MATQQTTIAGRLARRAVGDPAVPVDDRAAGDDASTSRRCATTCSIPTTSRFIGFQNYIDFLSDPTSSRALVQHARPCRLRCWSSASIGGMLVALLIDQPIFGPGHRAPDGHRAVLRHADRQRAGVEEPADAPGLRPVRLVWRNSVGLPAGRLVHQLAAAVGRSSSSSWQWLPFASADLADRAAVARRGAEGSRRARRRRAVLLLLLHRPAASSRARSPSSILIETIFLLNVFAEIRVTTNGGAGNARPTFPSSSTSRRCQLRRRRRLGGRPGRRRARQYRRDLPGAHVGKNLEA